MVKTQILECANHNDLSHSDQLKNVLKTKFRGQNKQDKVYNGPRDILFNEN